MAVLGFHKWTRLLIAIAVAVFYLSAPAEAKAKSSAKESQQTTKSASKGKAKASKKGKKAKNPKKVKIDADDPKAFTKALLLDKQGVEYEFTESKKNKNIPYKKSTPLPVPKVDEQHEPKPQAEAPKPKPEEPKPSEPVQKEVVAGGDYFDFSDMLLPITHEALVGSPYGIRSHRLHRGVDVNVIKDEPVVAAYPGEVTMSRYNKGGYGNYVLIKHPNGIETLYAHLSKRRLKVGDKVFPGDIVGLAGNSGRSSAAHLHFEIRYGEVNIDPCTVIDFPHWTLRPGVSKFSMKKAKAAHRKIQAKLRDNNYYIVKKGDSQGDVANWFNISIESLCRINNLKPGAPLKDGQKLRGSK
jgi:murein DD-endopeptidase MepM/ murein hydrolase activator NlpD